MTLTQNCFANITTLLDKDQSLTCLRTDKEGPEDGSVPLCLETSSFESMPHKQVFDPVCHITLYTQVRSGILLEVEPKIKKIDI